jgi:hypothetical protein
MIKRSKSYIHSTNRLKHPSMNIAGTPNIAFRTLAFTPFFTPKSYTIVIYHPSSSTQSQITPQYSKFSLFYP